MNLRSSAKINWLLHVGPVRPDGYHELLTVFQQLQFAEDIQFKKISQPECQLSGFPASIEPEKNLVTRAWDLMRQLFPGKVDGLYVNISKKLPMGGGLGGGSSNAACTLLAINKLYDLGLQESELQAIGARLGSDVSFFIRGGIAKGTGRGEILEQMPPCPKYHLVLVMPHQPMSTVEGYRLLDSMQRVSHSPHTLSHFLTELYSGDPQRLAQVLENDFELVAENFAWFKEAKARLQQAGALKTFLCGSGSTVAALVEDAATATKVARLTGGIPTHVLT